MTKAGLIAAFLAATLAMGGCAGKKNAEKTPTPPPTTEQSTEETDALKKRMSALEARVQALEAAMAALQQEGGTKEEDSEETTVNPTVFLHRVRNGGVEITGYVGGEEVVEVPNEIEGIPVLWIGENAFRGCEARAVILPQGVQEIGWFAFSGCYRLSEVTLPASIVMIGYGAFEGCSAALRLRCPKGSYAADYGRSYGIPVI